MNTTEIKGEERSSTSCIVYDNKNVIGIIRIEWVDIAEKRSYDYVKYVFAAFA